MTWSQTAGPFCIVLAAVLVPGLLVGAAAGLRRVTLVTLAPLVGYGVLTVAIIAGSFLHLRWGLASIAIATLGLALVLGLVASVPWAWRRLRRSRGAGALAPSTPAAVPPQVPAGPGAATTVPPPATPIAPAPTQAGPGATPGAPAASAAAATATTPSVASKSATAASGAVRPPGVSTARAVLKAPTGATAARPVSATSPAAAAAPAAAVVTTAAIAAPGDAADPPPPALPAAAGATPGQRGGGGLLDVALIVGSAVLAGVAQLVVIVRRMPTPDLIQQSWDAVFHLNAIYRVVGQHSASPAVVGGTADLYGHGAFYPPLFHALAALTVDLGHASIPGAANITALACACVLWPLSLLGLVHAVQPRRSTVVAAAVMLPLVAIFPVMLLYYGVLWPNLVGIAALPGALILLVKLLQPSRPAHPRLPLVLTGLVAAAGMYYAHPGTIFAAVSIALPLLAVSVLRLAWGAGRLVGRRGGVAWQLLGLLAGAALLGLTWWLVATLWHIIDGLDAVATLRKQDWKANETFAQALGEVVTLSVQALHPLFVIGALVIAGVFVVVRDRRVWFAAAHCVTIYLYLLAAGTDDPISETLTGFWYNDRFRILAVLPLTAIPLAAIGATWLADLLRARVSAGVRLARIAARRPGEPIRTRPWHPAAEQAMATAAVLAFVLWASPVSHALGAEQNDIDLAYAGEENRVLTTPAEVDLYKSLANQPDKSLGVVADPYTGGALASMLSGRPLVIAHMRNTLNADQDLVARRFKDFATDPAVCRAVKNLRIGYVTEDTVLFEGSDDQRAQYAGLRDLGGVKGLTVVAQEGTVTAYRVGPCRS